MPRFSRPTAEPHLKPYVFGKSAYIVLEGDLDLDQRSNVAAALPAAESLNGVVISLARATYVDSSVMGTLVQFRRRFIECGGDTHDLVLLLPKEGEVRRAFELAGMTALFSIAFVQPSPVSPEEYLTAFRSNGRREEGGRRL